MYNFPSSNTVMTRFSPATIGEESPLGANTFHFTFLSGPNSTGGFWPSAMPDPSGPRNLGHTSDLSAASPPAVNIPTDINTINGFMSANVLRFVIIVAFATIVNSDLMNHDSPCNVMPQPSGSNEYQ